MSVIHYNYVLHCFVYKHANKSVWMNEILWSLIDCQSLNFWFDSLRSITNRIWKFVKFFGAYIWKVCVCVEFDWSRGWSKFGDRSFGRKSKVSYCFFLGVFFFLVWIIYFIQRQNIDHESLTIITIIIICTLRKGWLTADRPSARCIHFDEMNKNFKQ